jgi:phage-related protein
MKTLSTPITNQLAATQSGWGELYDIYLREAITTPWGSVSTLRLTDIAGGISFFTPAFLPEPAGTQEDAQAYQYWPLKRDSAKETSKNQNDKLTVAASNVSTEWAEMMSAVEWRGVPIVIRRIAQTIAAPTAADYLVVFSGVIDSVRVDSKQVTFACSNELGAFNLLLPRQNMHAACRFSFCDDFCTKIRFAPENYLVGTVVAGSSTTKVASDDLDQDTAAAPGLPSQDLVDLVANNSQITASSQETGYEPYTVRASLHSTGTAWRFGAASGDWGENKAGYWYIPEAQGGLKNAALEPYWQIDLVNAAACGLWRLASVAASGRDSLVRMVLFFSSADASTWTFHRYFEMPPLPDTLFDVNIPGAPSKRYWRICIRSKWGETLKRDMLSQVFAYELSRNYWLNGTITFAADTDTAALQGVRRRVTFSHAGALYVAALPATPAAGDTFVVERGCDKSFNACAERGNTENFGGFDSLPYEQIVR